MSQEFQRTLQRFAQYLIEVMGEKKAIYYMTAFMKISRTDKLKSLLETLVLYACAEYGINHEMFFHSTKLIAFYARITCYHILKKHLDLTHQTLAELFKRKKQDSILDGIEKTQSYIDVPQYNKDFVTKYKILDTQFKTYSEAIDYEEKE